MKVGKWDVPTKLFEQYVRVINATERSSERYNYEFDEMRQSIHREIVDHVGLMPHTIEYREFHRALQNLCEGMLPERFPPQKITKLNTPLHGMIDRVK
jgi:hypothetical protein